jgi:hypothetical protein
MQKEDEKKELLLTQQRSMLPS